MASIILNVSMNVKHLLFLKITSLCRSNGWWLVFVNFSKVVSVFQWSGLVKICCSSLAFGQFYITLFCTFGQCYEHLQIADRIPILILNLMANALLCNPTTQSVFFPLEFLCFMLKIEGHVSRQCATVVKSFSRT